MGKNIIQPSSLLVYKKNGLSFSFQSILPLFSYDLFMHIPTTIQGTAT